MTPATSSRGPPKAPPGKGTLKKQLKKWTFPKMRKNKNKLFLNLLKSRRSASRVGEKQVLTELRKKQASFSENCNFKKSCSRVGETLIQENSFLLVPGQILVDFGSQQGTKRGQNGVKKALTNQPFSFGFLGGLWILDPGSGGSATRARGPHLGQRIPGAAPYSKITVIYYRHKRGI